MTYILSLDEVTAADRPRIGGKGYALAQLARRTGDRTRDLDEELLAEIVGHVFVAQELDVFLGNRLVVERDLGSLHALKVLDLVTEDLTERFAAEGRFQASLRHPNVVAVHDVGEDGDRHVVLPQQGGENDLGSLGGGSVASQNAQSARQVDDTCVERLVVGGGDSAIEEGQRDSIRAYIIPTQNGINPTRQRGIRLFLTSPR